MFSRSFMSNRAGVATTSMVALCSAIIRPGTVAFAFAPSSSQLVNSKLKCGCTFNLGKGRAMDTPKVAIGSEVLMGNRSKMPKSSFLIMGSKGNFNSETPSAENSYSALANRPVLAAVDFVAILIFASVGKASHSAAAEIDAFAVFETALPFLIAWFAISPLLGSYNDDATNDLVDSLSYTARGWVVSIPIGCAIRGLIKGYVPPTPFVIVTMISTLVILGIFRATYSLMGTKSG